MPGKRDAYTDEKPKDKRKKESHITLRECGGVTQFEKVNVYRCFEHQCGVSESMICFVKKMTTRSRKGLNH